MPTRRSPKEKKALSYAHDGRNVVAESKFGARKGIRDRKRWVNQSYRKATKQELAALKGGAPADPNSVEVSVADVRRHNWRKIPDAPLGEVVAKKLARRKTPAMRPNNSLERSRDR